MLFRSLVEHAFETTGSNRAQTRAAGGGWGGLTASPVSQKTILIKYNSRVNSQCKGKSKTYTLGVPGYYQKSIQFPKPQTGIPSFLKRNLQRLNLIRFHLESRLISCKFYRICSFLHHITLDNRCQFLTEN